MLDFGGKQKLMHRYIVECYYKITLNTKQQIDHIDGNKTNNYIENLRIVNNANNNQNKIKRRDSKQQYKGIEKTSSGNYKAIITAFGKRYYLGTHKTETKAKNIYDKAAMKLNENQSCTFNLSRA